MAKIFIHIFILYIQGGFAAAGWRPPAAPRTPVVVEDVEESSPYVRQYRQGVYKEFSVVESDWAEKERPYTLHSYTLNFKFYSAESTMELRIHLASTTQRYEYFRPVLTL